MPRLYTYGPFQSRRLGLSLGIDILEKEKICTYNCVYCEIGSTSLLVPPNYTISKSPSPHYRKEIKEMMSLFPNLDSITFGYNGEPTLNPYLSEFYEIASEVRSEINWQTREPYITLFTNSSTVHIEEIRNRIQKFDYVLAKLDAGNSEDFIRTNRPHEKVPDIDNIIDSLCKLRQMMSKKKFAIQCLIYNSYRKDFNSNNNEMNIINLAYAIRRINPDVVQIYSVARIPSEYYVYAINFEQKNRIVKTLKEIINNDDMEINYY
jgi:wyosine [tRNA(Phe)-imidazoG37] synthetase (radical SAM superfamily)